MSNVVVESEMAGTADEIIMNNGSGRTQSLVRFAPAFIKLQAAIDVVKKGDTNPHFKSAFASLPDTIKAVKETLNEHGFSILQLPSLSSSYSEENGQRLQMTTILLHESGEYIQAMASMPLQKSDPQGYGSAITYLRRYAIQSILMMPAVDDDGESAVQTGKSSASKNSEKRTGTSQASSTNKSKLSGMLGKKKPKTATRPPTEEPVFGVEDE